MTKDGTLAALGRLAREQREADLAEQPPHQDPDGERLRLEAITRQIVNEGSVRERDPQRVRGGQRRRAGRWVPWTAPLALAAGVCLWVVVGGTENAGLPDYSLRVSGGMSTYRGILDAPGTNAIRLRQGVPLEIVLLPERFPGTEPVSTAVYIPTEASEVIWRPTEERLDGGAIRLRGKLDVSSPAGPATMTICVGRKRVWPARSSEVGADEVTKVFRQQVIWE
jgi:hypothetical protein